MKKLIYIVLLGVLLLPACKTKKSLVDGSRIPTISIEEAIENVINVQPRFATANVSRMNMVVKFGDRSYNVSASCKIKNDSAIHLSIQPMLGIEMFKAEISKDSIWVFDKMNRNLYVADFGYIHQMLGLNVDFNSLQAIISNRFFKVGQSNVASNGMKISALTPENVELQYVEQRVTQHTAVSKDWKIQQVAISSIDNAYRFRTGYSDFANFNGVVFPRTIQMEALARNRTFTCDFTISRVVFDSDVTFSSLNPSRYARVSIEQLFKK